MQQTHGRCKLCNASCLSITSSQRARPSLTEPTEVPLCVTQPKVMPCSVALDYHEATWCAQLPAIKPRWTFCQPPVTVRGMRGSKLLRPAALAVETRGEEKEKKKKGTLSAMSQTTKCRGRSGCGGTPSRSVVSRCPLHLLQSLQPFSAADHRPLGKHTLEEMRGIRAQQVLHRVCLSDSAWAPLCNHSPRRWG